MRKLIITLTLLLLVSITGHAGEAFAAENTLLAQVSEQSELSGGSLEAMKPFTKPVVRARLRGHRFCDAGIKDITVLADRIEASLKVKSDGTYKVEGCRATPLVFLRTHQENDPGKVLGLTSVTQLPDFYRNLELVELSPGTKYWSGCTIDKAPFYVAECDSRVVGANGEKVWRHKASGKIVMLGNCANPAGRPDPPKPRIECRSKFVYLKPGQELRSGMLGSTPLNRSACLGIKRPGETSYTSVLLDLCPRENCDYSQAARSLGLQWRRELQLSLVAEVEGWYEIRFDDTQFDGDNVIDDCIIDLDGTQSLGMLTGKAQFYSGVGYLTAVKKEDMPKTARSFVHKGASLRPILWSGTKIAPPVRQ